MPLCGAADLNATLYRGLLNDPTPTGSNHRPPPVALCSMIYSYKNRRKGAYIKSLRKQMTPPITISSLPMQRSEKCCLTFACWQKRRINYSLPLRRFSARARRNLAASLCRYAERTTAASKSKSTGPRAFCSRPYRCGRPSLSSHFRAKGGRQNLRVRRLKNSKRSFQAANSRNLVGQP